MIVSSSFAQETLHNLNKYFFALNQNQEFNGSILVAEKGNIIYKESFGYADFQRKIENASSTRINIASISKTLTAIAVLQLMEKGKLNLDDAFFKHFQDFPYHEITVRQLLSHTSGLPDNEALFDSLIIKNPNKIFTNSDVIPALVKYQKYRGLRFAPGEKWGYSNIGYSLLALLVEKISNQPFEEYMKWNVFTPAGMKNSYVQTLLSQKSDKNRCINYMYNNHYEMKLQQMDSLASWKVFTYNLTGLTGSTNVISSVNDLCAFDRALYANKLLKASSLQEAFTPVKLNNGEPNKAAQGSYGIGWFIEVDSTGKKTVSHSGAAPGVTTFFIRNLATKQSVIIVQNIQNPMFDIGPVLAMLQGKSVVYKKSVAFAYAQDLYKNGVNYALAQLNQRLADSTNYVLTEKEMARVGLEFSRNKNYVQYSLEAYRLNAEYFNKSWKAFDDYASCLLKNGQKENAIKMYQRSMELNPNNQSAKKILEQILN